MNDGFYSPNWYKVAKLKPKLHPHVKIHRHDYRGLIWYLFEDTTTGKSYRFNPETYQFIGLLDGIRTVEEIYSIISDKLGDFVPGQQDIIDVLVKLNAGDLISSSTVTNIEELFASQVDRRQQKLKQLLGNPLAIKVPLWDPDKFLNKHFNKVKWLFSPWMAVLWLLTLVYASIEAIQHWPEISQHFELNALSPNNLMLIAVLYPLIKILHEFGHAFSAKLEAGEVHEMGVNFMLFMPIPYVNVSAATYFRNKYKRILVSAAGIIIESFLAAIGLILFLSTEPSLIRDISFNMFVIGGISSLFFNGNPLLKYDGYYMLADAIAIPNLYQRSSQYWQYLLQRYLLRISAATSPAHSSGENAWFALYGFLSQTYKLIVLWFIIAFVSDVSLSLAAVLAIWLIGLQIGLPCWKALQFVRSSPLLIQKRQQAWATMAGMVFVLFVLLSLIPVPSYTITEGIVWQPDNAELIAAEEGFAGTPLVKNNQIVSAGTTILELIDPLLDFQIRVAQAKLKELNSRHRANRDEDRVQAEIIKEEIAVATSSLEFLVKKSQSMKIIAAKSGKVLLPDADDLPGRLIRKGEMIGYVLEENQPLTIRLAITQQHIGQLRNRIDAISVRFINDVNKIYEAKMIRQAPEAVSELPSAALSIRGGGQFIVDPASTNDRLITEKVFLFDLELIQRDVQVALGTRAYVRIHHGGESVADQLYRRIRQTFLRQLNV